MEKLEATGAFEHVLPRQQEPTDNGLQRQIVDAVYVPDAALPKPEQSAQPAAKPGTAKPGTVKPGTTKPATATPGRATPAGPAAKAPQAGKS